jgi:hypothetical protein
MGYLIKEATPAWAAQATARLLAKAGIAPTASKYGSRVVKAYKNLQARKQLPNNVAPTIDEYVPAQGKITFDLGNAAQEYVPAQGKITFDLGNAVRKNVPARGQFANELSTTPSNNIPAHFEELLGRNMFHPHVPVNKWTNRQGITLSRAGDTFPEMRNIKTIRGTNGEEYLKMYSPAEVGPKPRLKQVISTKVTGDPVLDSVALTRARLKTATNPNLAKNYKGRLINEEGAAKLDAHELGLPENRFKVYSSMIDNGINAMWTPTTNSVWIPNKMQGKIFDNLGGSSVVSPGVGRKMVLDHENLGHRMMGGVLTPNQANAATQRYYWAMKNLNKSLGYKPVTDTRAVLEGVDQARAYANSNAIRLGENRFFANADKLDNVNIPIEEVKAIRDLTKQQVFGPNTNISDELFEAARSGVLHMRRNYRQAALR